jgi:hypothetical protein
MAPPPLGPRSAVALLGAALALSACGGQPEGTITPIVTTTAAPTSSAAKTEKPKTSTPRPSAKPAKINDPVLKGTRQVAIVPVPSFESIVALSEDGRLIVTDGAPDVSLFVFVPVKGKYMIRTAQFDANGENPCMQVLSDDNGTLTVIAQTCDPSEADQLFDVELTDSEKDDPLYGISNQSAYLQINREGELIAEELGAPLLTRFRLADNGKAFANGG